MVRATEEGEEKRGVLKRFALIPFCFMGIGFYRAWIELAYVRPVVGIDSAPLMRDVFDIAMVVTLIALALLARKIEPIIERKAVGWLSGILLLVGTLPVLSPAFLPAFPAELAYACSVVAGMGLAAMILLWSELFSCLGPTRVALYYAGSLIVGAAAIFVCKGFNDAYLAGATFVLPVISLACLAAGIMRIPESERPKKGKVSFKLPWKPIVLMACYAFAYGICESRMYTLAGPHSSMGVIVAALVVFFGIFFASSRFNFMVTYRIAMPTMVCGLLVSVFFPSNGYLSSFFVNMSYTSFSILIMMICATISHKWLISAVWLFGIERGCRAVVMLLGREVEGAVSTSALVPSEQLAILSGIVIVAIVIAAVTLISEKDIYSKWGLSFDDADDEDGKAVSEVEREMRHRDALEQRCRAVAEGHNLSNREVDVLLLLAHRRSISQIEKELFIANGTVKAHVRHIYEKLGIHSREELYAMVGVDEDPAPDSAAGERL